MTTLRPTLSALAALCTLFALGSPAAQAGTEASCRLGSTDMAADASAPGSVGSQAALSGEDSGSFWLSRRATSSRARTDVVAELARWHDSGAMLIDQNEFEGRITQGSTLAPSALTRAEVQAQVLAARAVGDLDASAGEDSGSLHVARHEYTPGATAMAAAAAAPQATMAAAQPLTSMCSGPEIGAAADQEAAPRHL